MYIGKWFVFIKIELIFFLFFGGELKIKTDKTIDKLFSSETK